MMEESTGFMKMKRIAQLARLAKKPSPMSHKTTLLPKNSEPKKSLNLRIKP